MMIRLSHVRAGNKARACAGAGRKRNVFARNWQREKRGGGEGGGNGVELRERAQRGEGKRKAAAGAEQRPPEPTIVHRLIRLMHQRADINLSRRESAAARGQRAGEKNSLTPARTRALQERSFRVQIGAAELERAIKRSRLERINIPPPARPPR